MSDNAKRGSAKDAEKPASGSSKASEDTDADAAAAATAKKDTESGAGGDGQDASSKAGGAKSDDDSSSGSSSDSSDDDEEADEEDTEKYIAPITDHRLVTFSKSSLNAHLVCRICQGYFREAQTIVECLHTFCKSCLVAYFHKGKTDCPHCGVRLGQQPQFRYDRTLQCLVDKVFPEFQEAERINEEPFYADRGIKRKALVPSQAPGAGTSRPPKRPSGPVSGPVECAETSFKLEPSPEAQEEDQLQELSKPFLRTSGQLRVMHLKKYLTKKLGLEKPDQIEILCKGDILGGELSLDFIKRTRWYDSSDLVLHYCRPSKERPQIM